MSMRVRITVPAKLVCPSLLFISLILLLSLCQIAFGQEEKAAEKAAVQKARQEAAAKEQASPKPEEPKKADEDKPAEEPKPGDPMSSPTFNGLRFRSIGPAFTSGRVIGFAVDPNNAGAIFRRVGVRRRVEDNQQRHDLDAGVRQRRFVFDRRDRARSERIR